MLLPWPSPSGAHHSLTGASVTHGPNPRPCPSLSSASGPNRHSPYAKGELSPGQESFRVGGQLQVPTRRCDSTSSRSDHPGVDPAVQPDLFRHRARHYPPGPGCPAPSSWHADRPAPHNNQQVYANSKMTALLEAMAGPAFMCATARKPRELKVPPGAGAIRLPPRPLTGSAAVGRRALNAVAPCRQPASDHAARSTCACAAAPGRWVSTPGGHRRLPADR